MCVQAGSVDRLVDPDRAPGAAGAVADAVAVIALPLPGVRVPDAEFAHVAAVAVLEPATVAAHAAHVAEADGLVHAQAVTWRWRRRARRGRARLVYPRAGDAAGAFVALPCVAEEVAGAVDIGPGVGEGALGVGAAVGELGQRRRGARLAAPAVLVGAGVLRRALQREVLRRRWPRVPAAAAVVQLVDARPGAELVRVVDRVAVLVRAPVACAAADSRTSAETTADT